LGIVKVFQIKKSSQIKRNSQLVIVYSFDEQLEAYHSGTKAETFGWTRFANQPATFDWNGGLAETFVNRLQTGSSTAVLSLGQP
jgi:hypothetical protein